MTPLSLSEFAARVHAGDLSIVEHTHAILDEAEETNEQFHHFVKIDRAGALAQAEVLDARLKKGESLGVLAGVPVSVKDAICVRGVESRAGSAILNGYVPPFDATSVARIRAAGGIVIGKTSQDEFGFGTFGLNTGIGFETPKNPLDDSRVCGGSSAGCGGFTALTKHTHVSLAESTGGSISAPAAFCGVAGLTPTYGRVSRYGLMDYASSLDKIGAMGKTVDDAACLLEVVSGHDPRESTSADRPVDFFTSTPSAKPLRAGLVMDFFGAGIAPEIEKAVRRSVSRLEKKGVEFSEVHLPKNRRFGVAAYYVTAMAEASTNLAKFAGMRYGATLPLSGSYNSFFSRVREAHFGFEAKRRVLLGTFVRMAGYRDAFYLKALKARTVLQNEFRQAFGGSDVLVHPAMPVLPPRVDEAKNLSPVEEYAMDLCTVPANFSGLPHASVPLRTTAGLPAGLGLTADVWNERHVIRLAKLAEERS